MGVAYRNRPNRPRPRVQRPFALAFAPPKQLYFAENPQSKKFPAPDSTRRRMPCMFVVSEVAETSDSTIQQQSFQRLFPPPKDPHLDSRYSGPWFPQPRALFFLHGHMSILLMCPWRAPLARTTGLRACLATRETSASCRFSLGELRSLVRQASVPVRTPCRLLFFIPPLALFHPLYRMPLFRITSSAP
jgi:hypothetical protein